MTVAICSIYATNFAETAKEEGDVIVPTVTLTPGTAERLALLAHAWSVSDDDVVARLLDHFIRTREPTQVAESTSSVIRVHARYGGVRVEGEYHVGSGRLDITAGPCARRTFKTPSGAAIAVVQALNPRVNPNRNGWSFWIVSDTGETLQSLRSRR